MIRFRDSVIVREVEGESVLLDLKRGYYFGLDRAGTRTWQLLRLNPRLRDVVSAMVDEYDVDTALRMLDGLLGELD